MRLSIFTRTALAGCAALLAEQSFAQTASDAPHLRKQGTATQLIVASKLFLVLAGELGNNTATSLENMHWAWCRRASSWQANGRLCGTSAATT